jgi:hypothetical protein
MMRAAGRGAALFPGWSPHTLDRAGAAVYVVLVDVPPKGDVYIDEPWLTIWWDSAHNFDTVAEAFTWVANA